jgi:hypothetical protein
MDGLEDRRMAVTTGESRTRERLKRRRKRGTVSVTTRLLYKREVNFFPPSNLFSHRAIPFAVKDNMKVLIFRLD